MPQALLHFSDEEDKKIEKLSKEWDISKHDVVKRLVREHKGDKKDAII